MEINRHELSKFAGIVGGAALIAGLVRNQLMGVWGPLNLTLAIVGGVLLLASIALNFGAILGFFGGRQGKLGANTVLLSLAVIAILAIANFLGYRHHKRFDLTAEGLYSLSDQTKKVVGNLQKDVKVIRFDKTSGGVDDQMAEFRYLSRRFSYERVDPQVKPEVARQYNVQRMGDTVVASGERVEHLQATDEQSVLNAIIKVTRDKLKRVCFTEGHGEKTPAGTGAESLSIAEGKLKNENYETKTIALATAQAVPAECDLLIVAGPKQPLLPPEVAMIGKYLDGGGKAMLLLDPETDPQAADLLKPWNVTLGNDFVLDVSAAGQMFGGGPTAPLVMSYGSHPITQTLGRGMTIFPDARSVKVGEASGTGVTANSLLTTSDQSWAETELKAGVAPKFDAGKDQKGPVSLGVAASKQTAGKEARLVVIGNSAFASNGAIRFQRNGDLFVNAVNWLSQDEDLISIRPKSQTSRSVDMSESQQRTLFWLIVLFMPVAVIGTGFYVWWKRR